MTEICGSPLYSNQTICKVMQIIDEHIARAETELANANDELDALGDAVLAGVSGFAALNYTSRIAGINLSYANQDAPDYSAKGPVAPTFPAAPTTGTLAAVTAAEAITAAYVVPSATTALIDGTEFDTIYEREADRLARGDVKAERDAVRNAARQGVGKSSGALSIGLARAQQETALNVSAAARDQSNAEATMLREDVKALHGFHIQNWPLRPRLVHDSHVAQERLEIDGFTAQEGAKVNGYQTIVTATAAAYKSQVDWALGYLNAETDRYRVLISEEGERRGWSQMALNAKLAEADAMTKYALEKMQYLTDITRDTQQAKSQLVIGAFQALISAANVNLTGQGSQSVTE